MEPNSTELEKNPVLSKEADLSSLVSNITIYLLVHFGGNYAFSLLITMEILEGLGCSSIKIIFISGKIRVRIYLRSAECISACYVGFQSREGTDNVKSKFFSTSNELET